MKLLTPANLRKYQWKAFWFLVRRKFAALFLDMGLGKTVIVLSAIKHLKHKGRLTKPVLIVAPIRVIYSVWAQEALKWSHTRGLTFSLVHGSPAKRQAALNVPADIYLINPQGVVWLLDLLNNDRVKKNWPFSWLVIDESSKFKAPGTQRFKKLRHFIGLFERRTILTGTPTPNHMLELWAQMFIVDAGARLGTAHGRFKQRFFYQADREGFTYVLRQGASRYIQNLIGDVTLRMDAEDYLDILPTTYNRIYVELPPHVREMYRRFEAEMFLELAKGDVEALSAATLSMRCHQLANGAIYSIDREDEQKIWEPVHDVKLEALQEVVEETGSPVIVVYNFKHDLERLRALYPDAPVLGNPKTIERTIKEWQQDKHEVVLAHPNSAAHGLDGLQHGSGHTIVFFSLTWSREQHDQLIKRIAGARATKRTMVHYIAMRGTVDEAILLAGERKDTSQRGLLNALKEYKHADLF